MRHLGRESHYSWDRPKRMPGRALVQSYAGVKQVLEDATTFKVITLEPFKHLYGDRASRFMLCGDGEFFTSQKKVMANALYHDKWHVQVREFYEDITLKLLRQHSKKIAGVNQVDITREYVPLSQRPQSLLISLQRWQPCSHALCGQRLLPPAKDRAASSWRVQRA